jgi:hypothetical protein
MDVAITLAIVAPAVWFVVRRTRHKRRAKRTVRLRQLAVAACESRRRKIIIGTVRVTGRYFEETGMEAYRGTIIRDYHDLPFAWHDTSHWTRAERAALVEAKRMAAAGGEAQSPSANLTALPAVT